MNKDLHLYDLDFTLWRTPSKLAVIDKKEPWKVIYRISPDKISMMKSYYRKEDLTVNYNGGTWYLNEQMWSDIKRLIGREITLSDIGISDREWTNEEILENQISKTDYLLENLNHLKGGKFDIGFLTARTRKKNHIDNINKLKEKVATKLKTSVKKVYFVNDLDENNSGDITSSRKAKILLEHLVGYKIKGSKFTSLKQDSYDRVFFYDDDKSNVEQANALQFLLEKLLVKTSKEVKHDILERIKQNNLFYIVNEITSNKLNPFIKYERKLLPPNNIKLFEDYV
jgi:hypothetical protein